MNVVVFKFKANITILPSTPDSGKFILGQLEHSFISDPSNRGHGDFKYIQDKEKKGSYFEFISRCPPYTGVFDFIIQNHVSEYFNIIIGSSVK